jgi:hypothetical protein
MIILGRSNDDKGTQLEQLTESILRRRGFRNIRCNHIGEGGTEIDAHAEYPLPAMGLTDFRPHVCECKAHATAIGSTDWLKFLGKIYTEEAASGREVSGTFIALSGVNGNVAGHYNSLRERGKSVELIDGDLLEAELHELCGLCKQTVVDSTIKRFTTRSVRRIEIFYYARQAGWLVIFGDEDYSLLNADGSLMEAGPQCDALMSMIGNSQSVKAFIDLQQEVEGARRRLNARIALISAIIQGSGVAETTKIVDTLGDQVGLTSQDIKDAAQALQSEGMVVIKDDDNTVRLKNDAEDEDGASVSVERWVRLYLELLNPEPELDALREGRADGRLVIDALGCPFYDAGINDQLLDFIQHQQGQLPLTEQEREHVLHLCRLSPTALVLALRPHPMLAPRRKKIAEEKKTFEKWDDEWSRQYFLRELCHALEQDFSENGLRRYFLEKRSLREIEVQKQTTVKSLTEPLMQVETKHRRGIGELAEGLRGPDGNTLILLEILLNAPQPWEPTLPASESAGTLSDEETASVDQPVLT